MYQLQTKNYNGQKVVDSRDVSAMVERNHGELLKTIRVYVGYFAQGEIPVGSFFIESTYLDGNGQPRPNYLITKKGCDMIANKMTGQKGVLFTAAYVTAFEKMKEYIQKPLTPAELMLEQARILVDLDHKVTALEAETNSNRKKLELLTNSPHFWRVEINERIKELAKINRVAESKLRNQLYTELEQASYSMGFAHRISLKTRLTRLQNRARNQGALSEAYLSFTKLDVIAQDKQLRETFEQIVENMNRQIVMN